MASVHRVRPQTETYQKRSATWSSSDDRVRCFPDPSSRKFRHLRGECTGHVARHLLLSAIQMSLFEQLSPIRRTVAGLGQRRIGWALCRVWRPVDLP